MTLLYEGHGLKKYYGSTLALNLPEFSLEKGAALTLEGANGSGKSTFLRILAFLEEPTEGHLKFFGNKEPRRCCTLLLQEPWLLRASVFANVVLGLKLRGIKNNLKDRYSQAMRAAGFQEPDVFAKRKPFALSGGEKQRVALASRLILEPEALLLDEPTAHVDTQSGLQIVTALKNARNKGVTIVCATHDNTLAKALGADRITMTKPETST